MTPRLFRFALLGLFLFAAAASAAERRYDFQKSTLDNGLTVLSLEDHSCPIVAVQVWYHVGSKDEDPQRQGFAHMFEHMMFRGTDRLGPEEHFNFIRQTGGDCNAFTAFDNTTYVNQLPSNQLELALWLEAERMAFLRIDDESFFKERAVVEEERRLRSLNTPYGMVPERLLGSIFTEHPYRWTPIGQIPHLRAATIDELQAFWDTYYVPTNATLVVVGDVRHAEVRKLAGKYFGWIPKCPAPPRVTIQEPPQTKRRKIVIPEKKGPVPIVGLVYRGVPKGHPDELALEMLMSIVGGGESSRIYKDVVKDQKIAQVAVAGAVAFEDDGLLGAGAVLMPWGNKKKVLSTIREHLERVRQESVTPRELEKARNQYLRNAVTESLTVVSKAMLLGQYQAIEGDADEANRRLEKIRAITADDLLRVAKRYLRSRRESVVTVEPQVGGVLKGLFGGKEENVDEGAAPPEKPKENRVAKRGGPRAKLDRPEGFPEKPPVAPLLEAIPDIPHHDVVLDNGLKVVVVPNHEVPFVTLTLGLTYGAWAETLPGTASMACSMLTQGSRDHTAAEMAEELEFNAISLSASASLDVATVNASCVTDKFDLATRLMAEVVRTPTFPKDEFEVLRKQVLVGLMVQSKTPEYLADRELRQRIFGSHPYSRTPTGEIADVQALKTDDLKRWWRTFARPDAAVLYVAGDVRGDAAQAAARKYFGDWKTEGPRPEPKLAAIPEPGKTQIYLVDRPGSVQSQIRVGHLGITRNDPGYFVSRVLSQVLGGGFNSRLNKAIRVEKGLTYGARGGFDPSRFAGSFAVSTFTKTPTTAETLRVIAAELDRIQASPPTREETDMARSYLVGSFAGQRETPQATVGDLWLIEYAGLPKDYLSRYLDGVRKTTADDVLKSATQLIRRQALTIVVVGEAAKIRDDLEKIAPVTVVKPSEAEAPSPEEGAAQPPADQENDEPDDEEDGEDGGE